jgi:hypothetical protein
MDANEKWYTVKQFACSFGQNEFTGKPDRVSVDSVQRWIKRGLLKAFEYPRNSSKRPRIYIVRLISETERQRFIRSRMTS